MLARQLESSSSLLQCLKLWSLACSQSPQSTARPLQRASSAGEHSLQNRFVLSSRCVWLIASIVAVLGSTTDQAHAQTSFIDRQQQLYEREIQPLLERYCVDCHGSSTSEAGLDLERYPNYLSLLEDRARWLKLAQRVAGGDMPPLDAPQPTAEQRVRLNETLDRLLNELDCNELARPGHVTIRRLNRFEYRNTVRDLTLVDYEPASDFPGDEVGYGFDHIGDVLTLSPLLLEKYLTAAEAISRSAIQTQTPSALDQRFAGTDLEGGGRAGGNHQGAAILTSDGRISTRVNFPQQGKYEIAVKAYGDQAGNEPVKMAIVLDDSALRRVDVRATDRNPADFASRVTVEAGTHEVGIDFLNDYYQPNAPNPDQRDRNLIVIEVQIRGPLGVSVTEGLSESHRQLLFETPADDSRRSIRATAERLVLRLASRAFRRPATDEEVDRLADLVMLAIDEGDNLETGMQLALQAVLVSPYFLFKVEEPFEAALTTRDLNDYELATSLSYFLWSTMPDDELLEAAWRGRLKNSVELRRQVVRMLEDQRAKALMSNFADQWLQLRALDKLEPDPNQFPQFTDELREDMKQETRLLFAEVVERDLSVLTLLTADFTFLNQRLAEHYGIRGVAGEEFRRVSLNSPQRGGLLTHASILTLTSNPTRTSPVKRGKWVLDNLLGTPPPPPAPGVLALEQQGELSGSLRERMEQHRANPACASCHARMDGIGFALENYDAIGRWREQDAGAPIDASGELPDGATFTGAGELQQTLTTARQSEFTQAFAEKLMTYALGRGLRYYDTCAVREVTRRAAERDHRFSEYVIAIVESPAFRSRSRSGAEP